MSVEEVCMQMSIWSFHVFKEEVLWWKENMRVTVGVTLYGPHRCMPWYMSIVVSWLLAVPVKPKSVSDVWGTPPHYLTHVCVHLAVLYVCHCSGG